MLLKIYINFKSLRGKMISIFYSSKYSQLLLGFPLEVPHCPLALVPFSLKNALASFVYSWPIYSRFH